MRFQEGFGVKKGHFETFFWDVRFSNMNRTLQRMCSLCVGLGKHFKLAQIRLVTHQPTESMPYSFPTFTIKKQTYMDIRYTIRGSYGQYYTKKYRKNNQSPWTKKHVSWQIPLKVMWVFQPAKLLVCAGLVEKSNPNTQWLWYI